MVEIIPAILVKTFEEVSKHIRAVENLVDWVQVDIVDGKFAPNITWNNPGELKKLKSRFGQQNGLKIEADLMIAEPHKYVNDWIDAGAQRIIFHQEAVFPAKIPAYNIISLIKKAGLEAGMSISPNTPTETLYPFVPRLDCVLLLGVEPGFGGQKFRESVLDKIRAIHRKFPKIPIEVDGGVNIENARSIIEAGAARLVAGSFIFQHPQGPAKAIQELKTVAGM